MLNATDELWLIRLAQKDRQMFGVLYDVYVDLVWRYAMKRLGDEDLAADATSQTFIKAMAALPTFRPEQRGDTTTFRSWLMMIARNVVIDEQRKNRTVPGIDLEDRLDLADSDPSPEEHAVQMEEVTRVRAALDRLPLHQRRIVELRAHGAGVKEIADALALSESAVKSAHYRAHQKLREWLSEENNT